jgi:hypothetical protein
MFDTPESRREDDVTAAAFADPQPGDMFHEMCSFWVVVVAVEPRGRIAVLTSPGGHTLPQDGKLTVYRSHDAYRAAWSYGTIPGYTVRLSKRGVNVTGWFDGWPPSPALADCPRCAAAVAR